jgi:hypothetical protein
MAIQIRTTLEELDAPVFTPHRPARLMRWFVALAA